MKTHKFIRGLREVKQTVLNGNSEIERESSRTLKYL